MNTESTGYTIQANLGRLAFYAALVALSMWDTLPWWAILVALLYDANYMVTWHSPKRKRALAEYQARLFDAYFAQNIGSKSVVMPGTEVDQ